ncbi:uncharacterized protein LOC128664544 [Bombina bombina]|uniref:uncharacterized protein LOC128664544 n=1 Tax=Bombina bombina TaxID=8345 RepID=UPI00235B1DD4|nr:uncharacterized protein LOC128664544 [Bombina bombina]
MDFSLVQPHIPDEIMPQQYSPLQDWSYPDSEGYSSLSPASSTDSSGFSPPYNQCAFPQDTYSSYNTVLQQRDVLKRPRKNLADKRNQRYGMISNQRQSASEREKMRMRNLSTSLQHLRRYLPPAVAPAGKNLTKIETLRLTIRYISHLSAVLGLDEESMIKKREEEMRSTCPISLSCFQTRTNGLFTEPIAHIPQTQSQYELNPCKLTAPSRMLPEQNSYGMMDNHAAVTCVPEFTAPVMSEEMKTFSSCKLQTTPIAQATVSKTNETFTATSPMSPDLGFCQNIIDDMWDELQDKDFWTSFPPIEINQPHKSANGHIL